LTGRWRPSPPCTTGTLSSCLGTATTTLKRLLYMNLQRKGVWKISYFRKGKLADFGTIKRDSADKLTKASFAATCGYFDPAYVSRMWHNHSLPYLPQYDVYSFGVLLLQTLTAREQVTGDDIEPHIVEWAETHISNDGVNSIVDRRITTESGLARESADLALDCVSDIAQRPSMTQVVARLEKLQRRLSTAT